MTALKPVYSRPSDGEDPSKPERYRKRRRRKGGNDLFTPSTAARADVKGIAKHDTPSATAAGEDDGMAKRHPATDGQNWRNTSFDHHERNRRAHQREKRRLDDLRTENERLHRRLAAVYDALNLD